MVAILAVPIISAIRADLQFLHESWMALFFPHQRGGGHPVLGRYRPQEWYKRLGYYLLALVGIPVAIAVYPFVIVGFTIRLATMAFAQMAARLGLFGVFVAVGILWGLLAILAFFQLDTAEFAAMTAAAGVATVAAAGAVAAHDAGGRGTTVAFAYPAGVTAIFLPPIVAALLWEPLGDVLLPASDRLAALILDKLLFVFGLNDLIRGAFDLDGPGFLGMWLSLSLVVGWSLGILVSLADTVRPRGDDERDPERR